MTPFEEFTARVVRLYWDHNCSDIDGGDLYEIALKSGVTIKRPVTQEEIDDNENMRDCDIEPGDQWAFPTPELLALMEQLK